MTDVLKSPKLAINGGPKVCARPQPKWPVWDETDAEALDGALRSGWWGIIGGKAGDKVAEFEQAFAAFQQAKHAVSITSGTAALEIALRACGLEPGDEVIVPAYTFIATASACLMVNAVPVFVDIEPDTYNIDPAAVEAAITPRTRAVVPVHIGGCPADLDAITAIGKKHNLKVIEDAAQAHGAEWKGRRVGAIGDVGCFSFQSSKNLNCGEGGACVSDNDTLYLRCWSLHNVGRLPEGEWYDHPLLGWNYRMTTFQAALLLSQMARLPEQMRRRTENAQYLTRRLDEIEGIRPNRVDERVTGHAYHLYIFRYDAAAFNGLPRGDFIRALNAEGVPCSSGYTPLYRNDAFKQPDVYAAAFSLGRKIDYSKVYCPVTERAGAEEAIWLYQTWFLGTREDMDNTADAILKVQQAARGRQ
jgi:dTDP-4-amino-4,6-dideoxygalactose transaminase